MYVPSGFCMIVGIFLLVLLGQRISSYVNLLNIASKARRPSFRYCSGSQHTMPFAGPETWLALISTAS